MGRKNHLSKTQVMVMLAEINQQTDRGAAIIAAAALDELLDACLQLRLVKLNRVQYDALFSLERPLGTFSAKIELGFALGLYNKHVWDLLHLIRDVRNKFSHKFDPITFDSEMIAKIIDPALDRKFGRTRRDKYMAAFSGVAVLLTGLQLEPIRIKSLGESHPQLFAEMFCALWPEKASEIRKIFANPED